MNLVDKYSKVSIPKSFSKSRATIFGLIFAVIGIIALVSSFAAASTDTKVVEAEGASLSGTIARLSDTEASAGQYLKFGEANNSTTLFPMNPNEVGVIGAGLQYSDLTIHNGDFYTSSDGQVVERMDIKGRFMVRHNNVTLRESRVMYTTNYGLDIREGHAGTLVEDSEFDGSNLAIHGSAGLDRSGGTTIRRVYLHNAPQGFQTYGNVVIEDSYLIVETDHAAATNEHREAVLSWGGDTNWLRNTFICSVPEGGCSAAAVFYGGVNPIQNVLVQDNYFAGAAGYCTYAGANKTYANDTANVRYINNAFDRRLFSEGGWKDASDTNNNKCGRAGDITSFDSSGPGNITSGNYYWPDLLPLGTPEP